jgi:hypothetical protein
MVDEGSELYYDPSLLTQRENKSEDQTPVELANRPMVEFQTPQNHGNRGPLQHQSNAYHQYNIPLNSPAGPSHHSQMMNNYSGSPVNMRMAMGGPQDGRSLSPDMRRRVTRAMTEDGYPLHGM